MKRDNGFTLIELMSVVAVIGILSAVAVPVFTLYIRRAKASEATTQLRALYTGAVAYSGREFLHRGPAKGMMPGTGVAWGFTQQVQCQVLQSMRIPATPSSQKQVADFSVDPSFRALGFTVGDPVYFSYQIRSRGGMGEPASCMLSPGPAYTFVALGDLDDDMVFSRYELAAAWNSERVLYSGGAIYMENEGE